MGGRSDRSRSSRGPGAGAAGVPRAIALARGALLALAYFAAAELAAHYTDPVGGVSPIWPAAGIAVGALVLWGPRYWPAVFLGPLPHASSELLATAASPAIGVICAAGIGLGAAATAVAASYATRRWVGGSPLRDLRSLAIFGVTAALLAPGIGATVGAGCLLAAGYLPPDELARAFWGWWLGDTLGILVAAPAFLLLGRREGWHVPSRSAFEAVLIATLLVVVAFLAFRPPVEPPGELQQFARALGFLPLVVWACLRFGLPGAVAGTLLASGLAVFLASEGTGPAVGGGDPLFELQFFLGVLGVTALVLGVSLQERYDALAAVADQQRLLEERVASRTEELRRALSLQHAVVEATADAILVVDRSGRIVSHNRNFRALWGLSEELLAGRSDRAALEAIVGELEDPAAFLARVQELYAAPEAESFEEVRFRDGRIVERFSRPQWVRGAVVGRVWSFREVTEQRRTAAERDRALAQEQQARRAAEAARLSSASLAEAGRRLAASIDYRSTLRAIVDSALGFGADASALYLVGADGPECHAAARLDGGARHWIVGEGEGAPGVPDASGLAASAIRAGRARVDAGGPALCAPLALRGQRLGALCVWREPSAGPFGDADRQYLEELAQRCAMALESARLYLETQEAVRVRDDFLSVASHELKTPLTTLKLQLQRLERAIRAAGADEGVNAQLDATLRQVERLNALIDNLLDISRITSHRLALELEPLDLAEVAREAVSRGAPEVRRRASEISLQVEGDASGVWDRVRLEQILGNLVSNAVKYGEGRPVVVRVQGRGEWVRLAVCDLGIGISEADQARIFERFERAVASRHYGGFGLGLWIVRQVVEALGGRIGVESEPGKGSTFVVDLPRRPAAAEGAPASH